MHFRSPKIAFVLIVICAWPFVLSAARYSNAQELAAEVNALRAQNGLPPYQLNPVLMAVAQAHAEYMAATGMVTHYSADGSRPFQRALAAGYPVAGDLTQGGFFSENIIAGRNMTAAQAVQAWTGDAPHLNTMLADHLTEMGVGVAVQGDVYYYVVDAARPASGSVAYTPVNPQGTPVTVAPPVVPVAVTSTPNPDGRVVHIVQSGQTLWTIAAVYGVSLEELRALNGLSDDWIQPGQEIIVRAGNPVSVTPPLPTPMPSHTATAAPTLQSYAAPATPPAQPTSVPTPRTAESPPPPWPFPFGLLAVSAVIATFVTIWLRKK